MKQPWRVFPEQFLDRLDRIIPPSKKDSVLSSFCTQRPTTIRTNTLKTTSEELLEQLKELGVTVSPVTFLRDAFFLETPSLRELTELSLYKDGYLYVQSLSSMIPPVLLDPQDGEKILDIAAAPGSKTTQIAARMHNTGNIIANDNSRIRLYKLKANLETQGVTNTAVINMHGQVLWEKYPEYFDRALVDAPCSMEGRFEVFAPKSYMFWSTKKIKELAERQRFLLRSAISATKPGGVVVYSTCTLAPEENEGVIDWILKKEKGAIEVVDIHDAGLPLDPAIVGWNTKTYEKDVAKTGRILPTEQMEGFFVAKLQKIRSTVRSVS